MFQTAERVSPTAPEDNYVLQRSLKAYMELEDLITGDVLELGCGEAYYADRLSRRCNRYIAVDKYRSRRFSTMPPNVEFISMNFPPLRYIPFNSYDVVICFQVLEHIRHDDRFLRDVYRVLKPGGRFVLTTPNRAMTLTPNPWHQREYLPAELKELMCGIFDEVKVMGISPNSKVKAYYLQNKAAVEKLARLDFLNLRSKLPRPAYRLIYDLLNRLNRKALLKKNGQSAFIHHTDFFISAEDDAEMLDIFCMAGKKS